MPGGVGIPGGGVTQDYVDTGLASKSDVGHNHDDRYFTEAEVTALLLTKSDSVHTHTAAQVTDFSAAADARIANWVGLAPGALDTLDELAAALGDDANFAATMTTALAGKAATVHVHSGADITSGTVVDARLSANVPL